MKFYYLQKRIGQHLLLLLCLSLPAGLSYTYAQEGGLPGILRNVPRRPPNPGTAKPRATPRPTPRQPAVNNAPPARPKPAPRVNAEDRVESELDNANDDRDQRRFEKAEKRYLAVLKARPREWRAAYGLGNVYADQQLWEKAEQFYNKASTLNPKNAEIFIALGYILLQPRTRGNDASSLLRAEQVARRALTLEKTNAAANDLLGLALEQRGILSMEAEDAFRVAIAQEPTLAVTYVHLGRFLGKKNRMEESSALYRKAISLAGEQDADTAILVAYELQAEQRWEDSLPLLEYALGKDKNNPAALMLRGRSYSATGRYEDAVESYKLALSKVPKTFTPHYLLGSVYQRLGQLGEAEKEFNDAFKYAADSEKVSLAGYYGFGGVGDAYIGAGRVADAVRLYERAVSCDPKNKTLLEKAETARKMAGR